VPSLGGTLREARRVLWLLRTLPGPARRAAVRRLLESRDARRRRLETALRGGAGRLVFVCHGNIMRSAFAEAWLCTTSPEVAGRVAGGGTHATAGRPAQDSAIRVAREFGVDLEPHRARPLEALALTHTDLVVCMDRANEAHVIARAGHVAARVFLIGDIAMRSTAPAEVADPYGHGDDATRVAFEAVRAAADAWRQVIGDDGSGVTPSP
jgi:protein-tyrosine-phosphatase